MSIAKKLNNMYYGWFIVIGLALVTFLDFGARASFGVYVHEWEKEFETSVGSISAAASIGLVIGGLSSPIYGGLIDRYGGRVVLLFGATLTGIGYILLSFIPSVLFLAVVWGCVIALATGGISVGMTTVTVARWFSRYRGMAMSFILSGAALGGLLLVPFSSYLVEIVGWRMTVTVFALGFLIVGVPVIWSLVRNSPEEIGLEKDGLSTDSGEEGTLVETTSPLEVSHWREALKSLPIWKISMAYVVCGVSTSIISVHYVRWAISEGISSTQGAMAFGLLAGVNGTALLFVGWLSDRMERRLLLGTVYGIRALGFLCLVILPPTWGLWAFAVIGGGSWLSSVPLTTSLTADIYGLKQVGTLTGLANCAHALGGAACVWIAGTLFDEIGTYDFTFMGVVVALIAAMLISWSVQEKKLSVRYQTSQLETGGATAS